MIGKTIILKLTDALSALGIGRDRLPDNLVEYFGLFASERQNVQSSVDHVRRSPIIGAKTPVHGLMLDLTTGRLEWVVNGYEAAAVTSVVPSAAGLIKEVVAEGAELLASKIPEIKLGELRLPEVKIGGTTIDPNRWLAQVVTRAESTRPEHPAEARQESPSEHERLFDKARRYKVIGSDQKVYKFTRDGKFLMQIGRRGQSKGSLDTANLNNAADMWVHPATNEVFVADGYINRRVIVFDADTGAFKRMWGAYGNRPDDGAPKALVGDGPGPQQ